MNKFTILIKENLDDKYSDKLSDNNKNMKRSLLQSMDKDLETDNKQDIIKFITKIIDNDDILLITDFTDDNEIINFYLKFQNDVDSISKDNGYLDLIPSENNIIGLNDFVLVGTKRVILKILKEILKDIK